MTTQFNPITSHRAICENTADGSRASFPLTHRLAAIKNVNTQSGIKTVSDGASHSSTRPPVLAATARSLATASLASYAPLSNVPDPDAVFCETGEAGLNQAVAKPVKNLYRNPVSKNGACPPPYHGGTKSHVIYNIKLETYIRDTLLTEVNRHGSPPLWLRPLAVVASWFGFHGVGQTNCMSCATAVADTLKTSNLHTALTDLRGGRPDRFATFDKVSRTLFDSAGELADKLRNSGDINAVVTVERPGWRRLFSPVSGHACNIIKAGDTLHLVDAQKKRHVTVSQTQDKAAVHKALLQFLGPVATISRAISLGNIGFFPSPPIERQD